MEAIKIWVLSVASAIVYGIVHDQVTARVCVEYFTIGHPPIFATTSPTLLGLGWGIVATWWVGAMLGVPLAIAARVGSRPKLSARDLLRPIGVLFLISGTLALLCGSAGYWSAQTGHLRLVDWLASAIPEERHSLFLADACAHLASYTSGFAGGIALCIWTWRRRAPRKQ